MPTDEERMTILRMVEAGKMTAEEAARLLAALDRSAGKATETRPPGEVPTRYVRVRVTDTLTGRQKASLNVPAAILSFGLRFVPDLEDVRVQSIRQALESGVTGRIADIQNDEDGTRVEIFVE